jgi:hypothetical protein
MQIPDPDKQSIGGAKLLEITGGRVQVNPLDDILDGVKKVTLIKIDVEGHELKALFGARQTIRKHKPELFIETFEEWTLELIEELLKTEGYELKERYCHAPVYHFSTNKKIPVTYK